MRSLSHPSTRRWFAMGAAALLAAVLGIGIGGLHARAGEPAAKKDNPPDRPATRAEPAPVSSRTIEGVVREYGGKPVPGAVVVVGFTGLGEPNHRVIKADEKGRYSCSVPDQAVAAEFFAYKEGWAPVFWRNKLTAEEQGDPFARRLHKAEPFSAILVDGNGRSIAGAQVRIEEFGHSLASMESMFTGTYPITVNRDVLDGSPYEALFEATTDRAGAFTFPASLPGVLLKLSVTVAGREWRVRAEQETPDQVPLHMAEAGFVAAPAGSPPHLVARPAARVAGRITTSIPGIGVAGLEVSFQNSHPGQGNYRSSNHRSQQTVLTGETGGFALDGLDEGPINIFVHGDGEGDLWTYRVGRDFDLRPGETTDVVVELIPGVEVVGRVAGRNGGYLLGNTHVEVAWPSRSRTGSESFGFTAEDAGRYHYRLPPGETTFSIMSPIADPRYRFIKNMGQTTVMIPEGVTRFDMPLLVMGPPAKLRGRIVDDQGAPIADARVVGIGVEAPRATMDLSPSEQLLTDASGELLLPSHWNGRFPIGRPARLRVRLGDGSELEVVAPASDGRSGTIQFATANAPAGTAEGLPR